MGISCAHGSCNPFGFARVYHKYSKLALRMRNRRLLPLSQRIVRTIAYILAYSLSTNWHEIEGDRDDFIKSSQNGWSTYKIRYDRVEQLLIPKKDSHANQFEILTTPKMLSENQFPFPKCLCSWLYGVLFCAIWGYVVWYIQEAHHT